MMRSRFSSFEASDRSPVEQQGANAGATDDEARAAIADSCLAWMANDPVPRLFVSSNLLCAWRNAAATRELALGQGLQLRRGVLSTTDAALQDKLLKLVEGATPSATVSIHDANGKGHVLVHAQRLDDSGDDALFGIRFHRIGAEFKPVYVGLDQAFDLTTSERRVMMRLIQGDTLPAVAQSLKLSVETIRTHARNIYAKTGVSSRAELFSLVRAFRL